MGADFIHVRIIEFKDIFQQFFLGLVNVFLIRFCQQFPDLVLGHIFIFHRWQLREETEHSQHTADAGQSAGKSVGSFRASAGKQSGNEQYGKKHQIHEGSAGQYLDPDSQVLFQAEYGQQPGGCTDTGDLCQAKGSTRASFQARHAKLQQGGRQQKGGHDTGI